MAEPLLSIDFARGIFRRYVGRSKYGKKMPLMTHKREINDEDWKRFREAKQVLTVEDVERYRVFPLEEDAVRVDWPKGGGTSAA